MKVKVKSKYPVLEVSRYKRNQCKTFFVVCSDDINFKVYNSSK